MSRCPRLRFRPLDADDVARVLIEQGRSEAEARATAATADGSVGHALAASGEDLVEARDVAARVLAQAAASDDARRRLRRREGAAGQDRRAAARRIASSWRCTCGRWRRCCATSSSWQPARTHARSPIPMCSPRSNGWRRSGASAACARLRRVDQALVALERNAGVKIVADWLVLQL